MLRPAQSYIEFALNQDYIAEFLCINKDKPKLECNGKCYLAQELKKEQKSEQKTPKISLENYPIGFVSILSIRPSQGDTTLLKPEFYYTNLYHFESVSNVSHPPNMSWPIPLLLQMA